MRRLFHMPLDPASRTVRFAMAEKGLPAQLTETPPWEDDEQLTAANPAGAIPVLLDDDGPAIGPVAPVGAILDYLDEAYAAMPLMPEGPGPRAETRRLIAWFTEKFEIDVVGFIVRERIDKSLMGAGLPDPNCLRAGLEALDWHLDYFSWILDTRPWFAGETFSAADVAAGAYISSVDYVDAIAWDKHPALREWYARIKSRPGFRPILRDRVEGTPPPRHYTDPDF